MKQLNDSNVKQIVSLIDEIVNELCTSSIEQQTMESVVMFLSEISSIVLD